MAQLLVVLAIFQNYYRLFSLNIIDLYYHGTYRIRTEYVQNMYRMPENITPDSTVYSPCWRSGMRRMGPLYTLADSDGYSASLLPRGCDGEPGGGHFWVHLSLVSLLEQTVTLHTMYTWSESPCMRDSVFTDIDTLLLELLDTCSFILSSTGHLQFGTIH